ncbi:TPA: aldo/keto reductase [Candidatus Poribacteria bacterium]|nr:aldo/keto reductase [Candidatus Poribacteria bacterium]
MIPKRLLGKTGQYLSIIGFGGILVSGVEQSEADAIVREAIDRGINYFDVAPTYGDAEEHLGPALEEFRRDVFLACKTTERQKEGAAAELHESLRRLRTDHFDLYQLHGMTTKEDIEQVFAPGGAIEAFIKAREQGLTRYIGFSAHSVETALALMDRFDFDTVLFPLNWVNYFNANFGPQVVAKAKSQNMGILALKTMARTQWAEGQERTHPKCWYEPVTDPVESELAIRFTLSEPITAAVTPGHVDLFRRAVEVAENFQLLSEYERAELRRRAENLTPIFQLADAA